MSTVPAGPAVLLPDGVKTETIARGSCVVRVHHRDKGPIWFGPPPGVPPQHRFDAPAGQYRILYAARALRGAFVETVLRLPANRIISRAYVAQRAWSVIEARRNLLVAKLYDDGLRWHGIDAGISAMNDYGPPRRLALALFEARSDLDGIAYRSRHNNGEVCCALFDRVIGADLHPRPPTRFDADWGAVERMMREHGAVFDTSPPVSPP